MENLWWLVDVVAPILLIAAIVYAWLRNRKARRGSFEQAERGAARLREDIRKDPQYKED